MAAAMILESRRTASGEIFISHTDTRGRAIDYDSEKPGFECLGIIEHPDDGSIALSRFTGARGGLGGGLTRSREAAKEDAKSSCEWAVFEYEYEYCPPGRTEYEYEGCREVGGF